MKRWLAAFLFTQVVEVQVPIYGYALRGRALVAFGASALTHPIVWFVIPRVWHGGGYLGLVAVSEAFAILAEAFYMKKAGLAHPLRWSIAANLASSSLGLTSRFLFGWP
jgi:hypothetical protein